MSPLGVACGFSFPMNPLSVSCPPPTTPPTRCHLEGLVCAACHRLPLCPGSRRSPCCYKEMALNP